MAICKALDLVFGELETVLVTDVSNLVFGKAEVFAFQERFELVFVQYLILVLRIIQKLFNIIIIIPLWLLP